MICYQCTLESSAAPPVSSALYLSILSLLTCQHIPPCKINSTTQLPGSSLLWFTHEILHVHSCSSIFLITVGRSVREDVEVYKKETRHHVKAAIRANWLIIVLPFIAPNENMNIVIFLPACWLNNILLLYLFIG